MVLSSTTAADLLHQKPGLVDGRMSIKTAKLLLNGFVRRTIKINMIILILILTLTAVIKRSDSKNVIIPRTKNNNLEPDPAAGDSKSGAGTANATTPAGPFGHQRSRRTRSRRSRDELAQSDVKSGPRNAKQPDIVLQAGMNPELQKQPGLNQEELDKTLIPPKPAKLLEKLEKIDPHYAHQWTENAAVQVKVGFYLESLSDLNPLKMAFDVDLYLRQSWEDARLKHNESRHYTLRNDNLTSLVWTPDLYFANAKTSNYQSVTKPNLMMMVYPSGMIHLSSRVVSQVACNLNLRNYPLDTQVCEIRILSYAYTETEVQIEWFSKDAISYNKGIHLAELTITGTNATYCNGTYDYGHTANTHVVGTFSCLEGKVFFKREIGYHLVQTYIPTLLIVIISWISFWIDPAAIPARISLSFTTLLTLATMTAGVRNALPPVAYAKAIDYWIGTCIMFVFGALLEFAVVSSFVRRAQKLQQKLYGVALKYPSADDTGIIEEVPPIPVPAQQRTQQSRRTSATYPNSLLDTNRYLDGIMVTKRKGLRYGLEQTASLLVNPIRRAPGYGENGGAPGTVPNRLRRFMKAMTEEEMEDALERYTRIATWSDTLSRFCFPAMFIVFNIIYWWKFKFSDGFNAYQQ